MSIAAMKAALEALELGQDAFSQTFGGYGYYRPDNPHNFFPDPECCTEKEIAHHSAACEAYDKGTYVPDHSDGWITPELHVTKAPWGIGTYTDECKEITEAITALRAAIAEQEKVEPVFIVFDGPPSHESGRFVEVETASGKSISAGEWNKVGGFWNLGPLYTHPQPVPDGWQLIETAPRDGTAFRAYSESLIDLDFNPYGSVECAWDGEKFLGCVWNGQQDCWYGKEIVPTHWMPLPSAPKEKS